MTDFRLDGHMWETEIALPQFHTTAKVRILQEDGQQPTERQREILSTLPNLTNTLLEQVNACAIEYYRRIDEEVDFAEEGRALSKDRIMEHFRLVSILIPEVRDCHVNYCFLSFDCDWEEEHGLQVLVADGELVVWGPHTSLPFSPQWSQMITIRDKQQQLDFLRSLPIY